MPVLPVERLPKYRKHRASGQAVVTLSGRDIYLGPHGTKASKKNYDLVTTQWLTNGRTFNTPAPDISVVELLAKFRRHAVGHYRKNWRPTRSIGNIDDAVRPLRLLYGREAVCDFGPLKLQAIPRANSSLNSPKLVASSPEMMISKHSTTNGRLSGACPIPPPELESGRTPAPVHRKGKKASRSPGSIYWQCVATHTRPSRCSQSTERPVSELKGRNGRPASRIENSPTKFSEFELCPRAAELLLLCLNYFNFGDVHDAG